MPRRTLSTYSKINNNSLSKDLNLYITNIFLKEAKITDLKGERGWLKKG
jgi:hypothetical protein